MITQKRKKIIDEVVDQIRQGTLTPGVRISSIRDMSERFGVSASVIQNAMRELMSKGLVECSGTSGFFVSESALLHLDSGKPVSLQSSGNEPVIVYMVHHNDLVWRYPYEEYAKIQIRQTEHLIDMHERHPELHFGMEQAAILKNIQISRPDICKKLRELAETGNFEATGGFSIPDLNMISGESLLRNLLHGREYYREVLGKTPVVACLTDAFGMSAQIPQVLKLCGYKYLIPGRIFGDFKVIPECGPFHWHALDGTSIIVHSRQKAFITHFENFGNMPLNLSQEGLIASFVDQLKTQEGHALAIYTTEEFLLNESVFPIIENANRTPGRHLEFGNAQQYFDMIANAEMPHWYQEFNPTLTGCLVTRIEMKQKVRCAENNLYAAEFLASAGEKVSDTASAWENLMLAEFHDAICGCTADLAHESVLEKLKNAVVPLPEPAGKVKEIRLCNTENTDGVQIAETIQPLAGMPCQADEKAFISEVDLAPCSAIAVKTNGKAVPSARGKKTFETKYFSVDFSSPFPVIRNKHGKNVFGAQNFAEILYRPDYGTMWTEYHPGPSVYRGHEFEKETVSEIITGPVFTKVIVTGEVLPKKPDYGNTGTHHWAGFESLTYRKFFYFYQNLDYFKLKIEIDWHGCNTKIAVRFPTEVDPNRASALYDIPFGSIVRKPYLEVPEEYAGTLGQLGFYHEPYTAGKGDWPALNYVDYTDLQGGLSVANTGTPGHHIAGKNITVSLLRSGTGVRDGYMVPQPGSFDNGKHTFLFAFRAHGPGEVEKAAELGKILNRPVQILPAGPTFDSLIAFRQKNVQISAIVPEQKGITVRLYETVGRQTVLKVSGSFGNRKWQEITPEGAAIGTVQPKAIAFRPFEIKTFRIS